MSHSNEKKKPNIFKRNAYCWYAALIAAAITLFMYAVWEFFPVGDNIILRMDLYHQYAPLFAELYERVTSGRTLLYSFTAGLGTPFLGNFFNYLSSPAMIFVFLFGHKNIPEAVAGMVLIKAAASSYTFAYFIQKITGKKSINAIAFALLYAFSGYFVAYYWNVMWLDAMVVLPLVMLGIYYIIERGNAFMYTLALAYTMVSNYYMAFMVCILSVIFFLYYYFSLYNFGTRIHPDAKIQDKYKGKISVAYMNSKLLRRGVLFALSSVLAFMIAAFALIPVWFILRNSSATSSSFPSEFKTYFTLFDFLANHLAGVTPTIRSSGDTVYPNIYCGLISLMLVPLYLFNSRFSKKQKIAMTVVLGIMFLSFNVNYLNFIWHGFHFPNDLPYRWSFGYVFFVLYIGYETISNIDRLSSKEILLSAISVAVFAVIVEKVGSHNVDLKVVWTSVIFAIIYAVVLAAMRNPKVAKQSVSIMLVALVTAEILISDTNNLKVTQTKESYTSAYDSTKYVLDEIKDSDSETDGFYRMELVDILTRMDNSWYNYYGTSLFTSMAYEKVANLQDYLGMFGNKINSYTYHMQTGLYNSMFSLKYILDNSNLIGIDNYQPDFSKNFLYTEIPQMTYGGITVYKNNYWLPLGFAVSDSTDTDWNYSSNNPFDVQNDFWYLASGVQNILEPVSGKAGECTNISEFSDDEVNSGTIGLYKENMSSSDGVANMSFTVAKSGNVYLYIKGNDIDNAFIMADNFSYNQEISDEPYVLDLGYREAGDNLNVELSLANDATNATANVYCVTLNQQKFISAYNKIVNNGTLNVTYNRESDIKGSINLASGNMLYTSIPYDTGWSVYVDGNSVPKENIVKIGDAMMGVKMDAGQHEIEFKYTPNGLIEGLALSVIGLIIIICYEILRKKKKLIFSPEHVHNVDDLYKWRKTEDLSGGEENAPYVPADGKVTEDDISAFEKANDLTPLSAPESHPDIEEAEKKTDSISSSAETESKTDSDLSVEEEKPITDEEIDKFAEDMSEIDEEESSKTENNEGSDSSPDVKKNG